MKTTRLQDINRALGDIPFESPYLKIDAHVTEYKWSITSQYLEPGWDELLDKAIGALEAKNFIYEIQSLNGIREIIVIGREA